MLDRTSGIKRPRLAISTGTVNRSARYWVIPTFEKANGGLRVELDQDIDVARALALTACDGTEQLRVTNLAPALLGTRWEAQAEAATLLFSFPCQPCRFG